MLVYVKTGKDRQASVGQFKTGEDSLDPVRTC